MRITLGLSLALLVASTAALAREIRSSHHHLVSAIKAKAAAHEAGRGRSARKRHRAIGRLARHGEPAHAADHHSMMRDHARHRLVRRRLSGHRAAVTYRATSGIERRTSPAEDRAALPPPDEYIEPVRVVGQREVGEAAWYGGRMVGGRTASGERLDRVHATAAHRWLPLYTLVKVTNLRNGRSVIATINDRGPVSRRLLIDLSPKAAEQLHMVHSGVAPVTVEPVVVEHTAAAVGRAR